MSAPQPLLLCSNGRAPGWPALDYGLWLATLSGAPVQLLGLADQPRRKAGLKKRLQRLAARAAEQGIKAEVEVLAGSPYELIPQQATQRGALTVLGPLGRAPFERWLRGSSIRGLLQAISTPFIFTKEAHPKLERILLCMGGLGHARQAARSALQLARPAGARLSILHVVTPIEYDYRVTRELKAHSGNLLEADIPQADNLRRALEEIEAAGLQGELLLREGHPAREILAEIWGGDYDLVVLGSPYSSHSLRHLFTRNVAAQVAEAIRLPVLVAREGESPGA